MTETPLMDMSWAHSKLLTVCATPAQNAICNMQEKAISETQRPPLLITFLASSFAKITAKDFFS